MNKLRVLALLLSLVILSSCGVSAAQTFQYDLAGQTGTLDPQLADNAQAWVAIRNIFEGLVVLDQDGRVQLAGARDYRISPDGLTYTFSLRQDAKWRNGTTVTAYDYLFAFQRLATPSTGAGNTLAFYCIKNFEKIVSGGGNPATLGVAVVDSYTLEFTLDYPSDSFLSDLSAPAAMPCNQEFFESTNARYGLTQQTVMGNGAFYVFNWATSGNLTLRRNANYYNAAIVTPYSVSLRVNTNAQSVINRFLAGTTDAATLNGQYQKRLIDEGFSFDSYEKTTWALVFNMSNAAFQNQNIRLGFAYGIDRAMYEHVIPSYMQPANGLVPNVVVQGGIRYREMAGTVMYDYDPALAADYFMQGLSELSVSKLEKTTIICPNDEAFTLPLSFMQKSWQDNLAAFINIEPLEQQKLESRLNSGNFQIALLPISTDFNTPESPLSSFLPQSSVNFGRYSDGDLEELLKVATRTSNTLQRYACYLEAEQLLVRNAAVIPIFFETSFCAVAHNVRGITFSPFGGTVVFKDAVILPS